jgi:hypothetical protein
MYNYELVILDALANKVKSHVNMFGLGMVLRIFCQRFCPGVVKVKRYWLFWSEMKFCE